jgi:hypothetical protein
MKSKNVKEYSEWNPKKLYFRGNIYRNDRKNIGKYY